MKAFLCPALELMILLPGMLLACLPVKQYLRIRPVRLAAVAVPLMLLLCLAGGGLCCLLSVKTVWAHLAVAVLAGAAYVHTLRMSRWKSVSVFLAVCGVFACLGSVAGVLDLLLCPGRGTLGLSPVAALCYNLMCWAFVGLAWYPAIHGARNLLEEEAFAQTWYVFWILSLLFVGLNLFMIPVHPELLYSGRMMQGYLVISLALLLLLCLFYGLFYLMAASLNRNDRLRQENQFLSMQQAQYDNLRIAIAETREARHDMRHHFNALKSLAGRREWEKLEDYLSGALDGIPDAELNLCENPAVDGVASHYGLLYRKHKIPFSFALDLPGELPVQEIDLCLVLSNLLENALEASLKSEPAKRKIRTQVYLYSKYMVLVTVENTYDGAIKEKNGVFQSSKRRGAGVGIQSVRRIAEKNGGYSRFSYKDGVFCANVMLRAEPSRK